jgi:hypothetical protein
MKPERASERTTSFAAWMDGYALPPSESDPDGKARQGKARQGKARQGKARQGKAMGKAMGKARQGKTQHSTA